MSVSDETWSEEPVQRERNSKVDSFSKTSSRDSAIMADYDITKCLTY